MAGNWKKSNASRQCERQRFSKSTWSRCSQCAGKGLVAGMFDSSPSAACVQCNAAGWIPPDGQPLEEHEALLLLRHQLNRQSVRVHQLRHRVQLPMGKTPADDYGNGRYNGD